MVMEAIRTSETSVYFNETTRRYIPEGCHLHTRRRKNLKFHKRDYVFVAASNGPIVHPPADT
jgi:hypothetical protein